MGAIIQIKQTIDALESGAGKEDVGKLNRLLSDFKNGLNPQDSAGTIVKMMQSINKYLITKAGMPHPDAIPMLASLGLKLETMVGTPSLDAAETKTVLDQSIREFKSLKAAISTAPFVSQSEFESLKAVILSVDWEISNITLKNFDKVISQLKEKVKSNKVHFTFLRIMHSLGGYVARNGSNANNDSITLLQSVFQDYEILFLNPDMPMGEKKPLIEGNIQKYKDFKSGLASNALAPPVSSKADEEMPPALSHLGSSAVAEEEATLSVLSEAPEADEEILPAFAGKENTQEQPRDVMGDLFSPKTTPADELLDAIHLAELHGPDQQAPAGMPPDSAQQEGEGVKNYTPERGRNEPIPEIASRLDEFFNLDVSEDSLSDLEAEEVEPPAVAVEEIPSVAMVEDDEDDEDDDIQPGLSGLIQPDSEPEHAFGTDGGVMALEDDESGDDDSDSLEALVPAFDFTSEDEEKTGEDLPLEMIPENGVEFLEPEVPELDPDLLVESLEDDDPAEPVLVRLKNLLNAPAGLADDGIYTQALEDLDALDQMWALDQNKRMLLEMLSGFAKYVHESAVDVGISVPPADPAGEEYAAADEDGFPENIELDEDEVQDAFSVEGEEAIEEDASSPGQTDSDGFSDEAEIEEKSEEDAVSFDDEFQPEEVDSPAKTKSGFFGRLMAKFRK